MTINGYMTINDYMTSNHWWSPTNFKQSERHVLKRSIMLARSHQKYALLSPGASLYGIIYWEQISCSGQIKSPEVEVCLSEARATRTTQKFHYRELSRSYLDSYFFSGISWGKQTQKILIYPHDKVCITDLDPCSAPKIAS